MSQGRHGIKVLSLSLLAALSLMAVFAGAAHAAEFRLEKKTFTADGAAQANVVGTATAGELLTAGGLKISCTGGSATGTVLLGGTAHAKVLFTGCEVLENKNCLIFENKMDDELDLNHGNIIAEGLGSLVLHGTAPNNHYLKVESTTTPFSTIWIGNTKGKKLCQLPLENVVTGSAVFFAPKALEELETQTLETVNAATRTLLGVQLFYGAELAHLAEGTKASVKLESGKIWGGE